MSSDESTLGRRPLPAPPKRRRCLRIVESPDQGAIGRVIELESESIVLGRVLPEGQIAIRDPRMSREHARLSSKNGRWFIDDLETQNGTFVSGHRVKASHILSNNDVISVGETLLVLDVDPDPEDIPSNPSADAAAAHEVAGVSFTAEVLRRAIASVARAKGPVLILGETGTGKEVTAQAIHRLSGRKGPIVSVNCAAIPAELAEAQLFGHRRGAFTGAVADHEGLFARADGGTLFLDEIGELAPPLQAKLLRVLEDGIVTAVGESEARVVDVRVLAATNAELTQGSDFRSDLYARLVEHIIRIPPLSRRRADVLLLWDRFQEREAFGGARRGRTAELSEALLLYDWPLNVRELARLARRTATLAADVDILDLQHVPATIQRPLRERLGSSVDEIEWNDADDEAEVDTTDLPQRATLEEALRSAKGVVSRAAQALGMHRQQMYRVMHRLGIDPRNYR